MLMMGAKWLTTHAMAVERWSLSSPNLSGASPHMRALALSGLAGVKAAKNWGSKRP